MIESVQPHTNGPNDDENSLGSISYSLRSTSNDESSSDDDSVFSYISY